MARRTASTAFNPIEQGIPRKSMIRYIEESAFNSLGVFIRVSIVGVVTESNKKQALQI